MTTLNELRVGQRARIDDVSGEDAVAIRLMEMGFTEGEEIEFLGSAPLGDPLEFSLRGYRISLRRTEAARVLITAR
jgi:ferrous iron transport protein A